MVAFHSIIKQENSLRYSISPKHQKSLPQSSLSVHGTFGLVEQGKMRLSYTMNLDMGWVCSGGPIFGGLGL
jgi:hypothetical protein